MERELPFYLGFSLFPGVGPVRFGLLRDYFGSAQAAWEATEAQLVQVGLGTKLSSDFVAFRRSFNDAEYQQKLLEQHVSILLDTDPRYPQLLKQVSDHPFLLYIKGRKTGDAWDLSKTIAIVGTRKVTSYGAEVTDRLARDLVGYGYTIVSGMAYGVDAVAHRAALSCGGKTIAVLGCGVDIIAPPSNANIYHQIIEGGGAVISEMPLGLRPNKGMFPARNRIVSGLSRGVVVTEGAEDSGSLITARNAAEQGREVFAVPGPITSMYSAGPAQLLKKGAKVVTSARDIIEELEGIGTADIARKKELNLSEFVGVEREVVTLLSAQRLHVDEIVRKTHAGASQIISTIMMLEIRGVVRDFGDKMYGLR